MELKNQELSYNASDLLMLLSFLSDTFCLVTTKKLNDIVDLYNKQLTHETTSNLLLLLTNVLTADQTSEALSSFYVETNIYEIVAEILSDIKAPNLLVRPTLKMLNLICCFLVDQEGALENRVEEIFYLIAPHLDQSSQGDDKMVVRILNIFATLMNNSYSSVFLNNKFLIRVGKIANANSSVEVLKAAKRMIKKMYEHKAVVNVEQ